MLESLVPAPADALVDAFGVVIHLQFLDSVYADHGQVEYWLSLLGVRHVRNRLSPQPEVLDAFSGSRLPGSGCRACAERSETPSPWTCSWPRRADFPDPTQLFSAFEGINEPNNSGVPWVDETRSQGASSSSGPATTDWSMIPIVAPRWRGSTAAGAEGADTLEQAGNLGRPAARTSTSATSTSTRRAAAQRRHRPVHEQRRPGVRQQAGDVYRGRLLHGTGLRRDRRPVPAGRGGGVHATDAPRALACRQRAVLPLRALRRPGRPMPNGRRASGWCRRSIWGPWTCPCRSSTSLRSAGCSPRSPTPARTSNPRAVAVVDGSGRASRGGVRQTGRDTSPVSVARSPHL